MTRPPSQKGSCRSLVCRPHSTGQMLRVCYVDIQSMSNSRLPAGISGPSTYTSFRRFRVVTQAWEGSYWPITVTHFEALSCGRWTPGVPGRCSRAKHGNKARRTHWTRWTNACLLEWREPERINSGIQGADHYHLGRLFRLRGTVAHIRPPCWV